MSAPHDPPTAQELLKAVREFLETDVMASTEGRVQFHTRVAINVLAIVEREIDLGAKQQQDHAARLGQLGLGSEEQLANAIKDGSLSADQVLDTIRKTVAAKLEAANPSYLDD